MRSIRISTVPRKGRRLPKERPSCGSRDLYNNANTTSCPKPYPTKGNAAPHRGLVMASDQERIETASTKDLKLLDDPEVHPPARTKAAATAVLNVGSDWGVIIYPQKLQKSTTSGTRR